MRKGNGLQWLIRPGVDTGDEPTLTIWLSQCQCGAADLSRAALNA